jgi:hypothetical protein
MATAGYGVRSFTVVMNSHRSDSDRRLHLTSGNAARGLMIVALGSSSGSSFPEQGPT